MCPLPDGITANPVVLTLLAPVRAPAGRPPRPDAGSSEADGRAILLAPLPRAMPICGNTRPD